MKASTRGLWIGAFLVAGLLISGCSNNESNQSIPQMLDDIANKKSTGAETSTNGHALCINPTDLMAFIGTSDSESDSDKTKEAQQKALFNQDRCTFISSGVHYDVDAEGREIYHTPHGTVALWPGQ